MDQDPHRGSPSPASSPSRSALPSGISILNYDIAGTRDPAGEAFAATPEMWAAVRRYAGPADRVGNNPMFLESMTPWPVNISWALLSNRRSCYAGYDLALPFIPLPRQRGCGRSTRSSIASFPARAGPTTCATSRPNTAARSWW